MLHQEDCASGRTIVHMTTGCRMSLHFISKINDNALLYQPYNPNNATIHIEKREAGGSLPNSIKCNLPPGKD